MIRNSRFDGLLDSEVWKLFKHGNEDAFDYIYQISIDKLYNYGCQFTNDHALVEDAIQDLFIDLRRRASYLSDTDRIIPYLMAAFRRKIIRMRDKARKNQEIEDYKSFDISVSHEQQIISSEINQSQMDQLKRAMDGLPHNYREIIYYFYYENRSYLEIQEILGFDHVKSVRNLLYKAIKSLRDGMTIILLLISIHFNIFEYHRIANR